MELMLAVDYVSKHIPFLLLFSPINSFRSREVDHFAPHGVSRGGCSWFRALFCFSGRESRRCPHPTWETEAKRYRA